MRFSVASASALALSVLSIPATVTATYNYGSQPSQGVTNPFYCPEVSLKNLGKMDWLCDKPPYTDKVFGCTYRNGAGTSSISCIYDVLTGKCESESEDCPKSAWDNNTRKRYLAEKKRSTSGLGRRMHNRL
ncbi:hypothetical protein VKT23_015547 [Stygiomarasmius scandens]|uniref:Uncharacterized protein n=1 Tax=Marasmiellus scandens TaxID=2682957 RepID=A0ABR1IXJ8_9AGAR